jgi:hypothetical protein
MLKLLENQNIILDILKNLPSESVFVDYKEVYDENCLPPCKNDITKSKKQLDFIKDIIAFLNSNAEICDDRFILYGVSEDKEKGGYSITGLNDRKFPDDANLQPVFELIYPRPIIHTGTIPFEDKTIGYIHIDKNNKDFMYEAIEIASKSQEKPKEKILHIAQGQSWIRVGSKKEELFGEARIEFIKKHLNKQERQIVYDLDTDYELRKTIIRLAVIGEWSDDRDDDRNIVAEICEKEYDEVKFTITQNYPELLRFENKGSYAGEKSIYVVTNRDTYLSQLSVDTFSKISALILDILKNNKYKGTTLTLSDGIGYTLAYLSDKKEFKNALSNIVSEILKDGKLTHKAEHILPYLVEVSQQRLFSYIENRIEPDNWSQIEALRTLAWYDDCFVQAVLLLHKINYSNLSEFFIPSNVTTEANTDTKIGALRALYKEDGENNLEQIMTIIKDAISLHIGYSPSHKPIKFGSVQSDKISISFSEMKAFFDLALELSNENIEIILELLPRCIYYPLAFLPSVIEKANDLDISKLTEYQKFELWNRLCVLPIYSIKDTVIDEKELTGLRLAGERFKPDDGDIRKWFENDAFEFLRDDEISASDTEKQLRDHRIDALKSIYNESGISGVICFLETIEKDIWNIDSVLEALNLSAEDNNMLISEYSKSEKVKNIVHLYFRRISYRKDVNWIASLKFPDDLDIRAEILSCFYINDLKVIEFFDKLLNNDVNHLWKYKTTIGTDDYEVYKYAIRKFIEFEKYNSAIHNTNLLIHSKEYVDAIESDFVYEILNDMPIEERLIDEYFLFKALEILHNNNFDKNKTIKVELKYCNEVSIYHYPVKALCFSEKCVAEPEYFVDYLKSLDTHYSWKYIFIFNCFACEIAQPKEWIKSIENLIQNDNIDFKYLVYESIGKIFNRQISYDKDGILEIPEDVADVLEQNPIILNNFSIDLFNSQGAYILDAGESIANRFKSAAKAQLGKGRKNLYSSLFEISKDYHSDE